MLKLWGPRFCPHKDCRTPHREQKFRFWTPQTQKNKNTDTDAHKHTRMLVRLRKQTTLHCLFMNSSVCHRQTGDEDIYSVMQYGHILNIINLLSNLPSALLTHLVILYSQLITYHKTAGRSQPSSATFVTFEVLQGLFFFLSFFLTLCSEHPDTKVADAVCFKIDWNRALLNKIM